MTPAQFEALAPRFYGTPLDEALIGRVRDQVRLHFEAGGSPEDLRIEPNRPESGCKFALVGPAPPASSSESWHRCSYCQTDRRFKSGNIVICDDGYLRLIGTDCWSKYIELDAWQRESRDLSLYERRRKFNASRLDLVKALDELRMALRRAVNDQNKPTVRSTELLSSQLQSHMPELTGYLNLAAGTDGVLGVEADGSGGPTIRSSGGGSSRIIVEIHRPVGLRFLHGCELEGVLSDAIAGLYKANDLYRAAQWDVLSNEEFGKKHRQFMSVVSSVVGGVREARKYVQDVLAFFSDGNLRGLARWASDRRCPLRRDCEISVARRTIKCAYPSGRSRVVHQPAALEAELVPNPEVVASLASIRGSGAI